MTSLGTLVIERLRQFRGRLDQLGLQGCSGLLLMRSLAPACAGGVDSADLRVAWDRELTKFVDRVDAWLHQVSVCVQRLVHAILLGFKRTRSPLRLSTLEVEYVSTGRGVLHGDLVRLTWRLLLNRRRLVPSDHGRLIEGRVIVVSDLAQVLRLTTTLEG